MEIILGLSTERRRRKERRLQVLRENRMRMRKLRDSSNPFEMPDKEFQTSYRLSKELARGLIEELRPLLAAANRSTCIPIEIKVLCALHFFGQGGCQRAAGSDCFVSLSQPSVSRAIKEVSGAFNSPEILGKWIVFPWSQRERKEIMKKNERASGIPGVLGFVDATHIPLKTPHEEEHEFYNSKNYHSINAQIVCDSGLRILNILARWPGSASDVYVWRNSAMQKTLIEIWTTGERCWLLGDSCYPHEPWLQTPILNAPEGSPEENYMRYHTSALSTVRRCVGVLKGRFRCLQLESKLECSPLQVCRVTNACCVLHNMCIQGGVPFPEEEMHLKEEEVHQVGPMEEEAINILQEARAVQESIIRRLQN